MANLNCDFCGCKGGGAFNAIMYRCPECGTVQCISCVDKKMTAGSVVRGGLAVATLGLSTLFGTVKSTTCLKCGSDRVKKIS